LHAQTLFLGELMPLTIRSRRPARSGRTVVDVTKTSLSARSDRAIAIRFREVLKASSDHTRVSHRSAHANAVISMLSLMLTLRGIDCSHRGDDRI